MQIEFAHDNYRGCVSVSCVSNTDPARVGQGEAALGFPMCTATIDYPGRGYRALFGWVQLVRSTDNASDGRAFEMDPFILFEDSPAPYCWYGFSPTMFDAPSRDDRRSLEWRAHSFLANTPFATGRKQVVPVLGFSWGFDIDERERITVLPVSRLAADDWATHLPYLRTSYPDWEFPAVGAFA